MNFPAFADIARRIADGAVPATHYAAQALARIRTRDPGQCYTAITQERALAEALVSGAAQAAGSDLPLAGVPYAVKNLFDIAGLPTLAGAHLREQQPPAQADAEVIRRLQAAGAVLTGAVNMDENAYGFTTENTWYGTCRNPHDPSRLAGGSSGGSAVAVADGMVPLALGSDTNGSVRVPSSLCGIFGLKPTFGRLPRNGSFPFVHSLDHVGLMTTRVADLATAYDVLQGPCEDDPYCARRPAEPVAAALQAAPARPLRVAVLGGYFQAWANDEARRAVDMAAHVLNATDTVTLAQAELARAAAFVITAAEGGNLHRATLARHYQDYEPRSRDRLVAGSLVPASWVEQAQRLRRRFHAQVLTLLQHYDVLLAPATPTSAPLIGTTAVPLNDHFVPTAQAMGLLTQPISFIGLPVCVAPIWPGLGATAHLPLGVQLIAAPWREDLCLNAARQLEQAGIAMVRQAA
ncbi:AtzE family amidohydrolase [Kerstersia similis]|uniref:AtzE family amidohydrolase n=1 Tax=Kerstersia similis TaxID=206505 RepID=UPI0039EFFA48